MGQDAKEPTITVLGGTGHVGATYIEEFLAAGLRTRILARAPERSEKRFPRAEVLPGFPVTSLDEYLRRAFKAAEPAR